MALILGLPPDSRLMTALRGYEHWDTQSHLLAGLYDSHRQAHFKNTKPLTRPGATDQGVKRRGSGPGMTLDQAREWNRQFAPKKESEVGDG